MDLGMMWSWSPVFPGRMPLKARNTARGEPMQKKFSTCNSVSELYYMEIQMCYLYERVDHSIKRNS